MLSSAWWAAFAAVAGLYYLALTFAGLGSAGARHVIGQVRDFLAAVRTTPLPTVAMINGYCLGAAFELALACDLRVATDDAQFGLPEVKVGIPSVADAALLPAYVGLARAKEIILTGDLYPAADLHRWGLLNRVVPPPRLEAETLGLLSRITQHTRTVLASQKRLFEARFVSHESTDRQVPGPPGTRRAAPASW